MFQVVDVRIVSKLLHREVKFKKKEEMSFFGKKTRSSVSWKKVMVYQLDTNSLLR